MVLLQRCSCNPTLPRFQVKPRLLSLLPPLLLSSQSTCQEVIHLSVPWRGITGSPTLATAALMDGFNELLLFTLSFLNRIFFFYISTVSAHDLPFNSISSFMFISHFRFTCMLLQRRKKLSFSRRPQFSKSAAVLRLLHVGKHFYDCQSITKS